MQDSGEIMRQTATLSGGELSYFVAGDGPDVLILHGDEGPAFRAVAHRLRRKFRVWLPVLPDTGADGHGAMAALLSEFIEARIGKPCELVGVSQGAAVAAWLAMRHPGNVEQLVLMAPSGFAPAASGRDGLADRMGEIRACTLILSGSRSEPATAHLLRSTIRRSHLIHVYGAGQALETDQPDRVASLIEDFLLRGDAFIVNAGSATRQPAAPA